MENVNGLFLAEEIRKHRKLSPNMTTLSCI